MSRALALLVFGALVAALFRTDPPSATRLAGAEVGKALLAQAEGDVAAFAGRQPGAAESGALPQAISDALADPEDGKELQGTLVAALFQSAAARRLPPEVPGGRERLEVLLGGARLASDEDETWDPMWPAYARQSVLRQLRATCESLGVDLVVQGLKEPRADGVHVLGTLSQVERELALELRVGTGPTVTASRAWRPIDQLSLLPPLIAIFLAILLRRPVAALFAGLWAGAALLRSLDGASMASALGQGLRASFDTYLYGMIRDQAKIEIVLFVVFMLAMVGVITRAGGIRGVMERLSSLARDAKRTQVATWLMGLAIFFDDYANTILVGSTMRPLTDKFKVAREKLAYIVDSTAAPVAGISVLSTWIAFEVSTFSPSLPDAELASSQGYAIFLQTLPYRFYCILTLVLVGLVVLTGRDFGPMLTAERRARSGKVLRDGAVPMIGEAATRLEAEPGVRVAAVTALVPLFLFVSSVLGLIMYRGGAFDLGARLFTVEGATQVLYLGSGNQPLMYGALIGFGAALLLALRAGLRISLALRSAVDAIRSMGVALAILYLAWSLGKVCDHLGTATFLSVALGDTLPWMILPATLFTLSGMIAFSTGSSWSTMTILLPLVVGLAYNLGFDSIDASLGMAAQRAAGLALLVISIGAVLEGAIFGDHCSPISDTTVMSSISSASDHIDHVRTQMPYALLAMFTALLCGYFPATFLRWNPFLCLALGVAVMALFLRIYGRRADDPPSAAAPEIAR
jgi:Na+/H+ antiporter NhaC